MRRVRVQAAASAANVAAVMAAASPATEARSSSPDGDSSATATASSSSRSHPRIRAVQAAIQRSRIATKQAMDQAATGSMLDASPAEAAAAIASALDHSTLAPGPRSGTRHGTPSPLIPSSTAVDAKPPWRRILYELQPYEDNYVDDTFLSSLVTNANVRPLSYWRLCLATCALTQRICLLVLFLLLFYCMLHGLVSIESILLLDASCMVVGLTLVLVLQYACGDMTREDWIGSAWSSVQRVSLLTLCLLFLSPLLNTLTLAFSSDTIWALTFLLAAVHLLWFDYRWINEAAHGKRQFEGTLSLNAGVFASILLGSRFQVDSSSSVDGVSSSVADPFVGLLASAHVHCFGFILWSFLVFGGMSVLGYWIRRWSLRLHVCVTASLVSVCAVALCVLFSVTVSPLPLLLLPVFLVTCIAVNLVAPRALIFTQKYKNALHGPWDYDDANEMESDNL